MFVSILTFVLLLLISEAIASPRATLITPRSHALIQNSRRRQYNQATLVSRKTISTTSTSHETGSLINPIPPTAPDEMPKWDELSFPWKCVFGGVEIAYIVGSQWLSGFATAYLLGSMTGLYGFSQPLDATGLTRFSRWNQRSMRWGKSWGSISASFSGFDAGVRLLRNNRVDEWNSLLGSACAGAFFVRSQGPAAMAKSAALYASVGYFFMRAGRNKQMYVEEEQIL
jgi:Tim17/Tim22/Tim23/Pmp24 family